MLACNSLCRSLWEPHGNTNGWQNDLFALNFSSPPFALITFLRCGQWVAAFNIRWGWMATDPTIYNPGITGVGFPAAENPDQDNRPFSPADLFFFPPLDPRAPLPAHLHCGSKSSPLPGQFSTLPTWRHRITAIFCDRIECLDFSVVRTNSVLVRFTHQFFLQGWRCVTEITCCCLWF